MQTCEQGQQLDWGGAGEKIFFLPAAAKHKANAV
jgi:hypothetical protein